jgi:predicted nuclease of predicted toxin-antitoxin system
MRRFGTRPPSTAASSRLKTKNFRRLSILRGAPPKVIWLRLGNCTTDEIEKLLRRHHEDVIQFAEHPEATFLELGGTAAS